MATTSIEWTDATWNPITGCTKVSPGCKNCYAETVAGRFWGKQYEPNADGTQRRFTDVRCHPERLEEPLRWRKPRRVFVNSMSDLFHEDVPQEFFDRVMASIALSPRHTFQVLTKRPEIMYRRMMTRLTYGDFVSLAALVCGDGDVDNAIDSAWGRYHDGLPNLWLGVSCEDQPRADERIPLLLQAPAAVRFVSLEPLLGPIDIAPYLWPTHWTWDAKYDTPEDAIRHGAYAERKRQALVSARSRFLDWVIAGGESGPGARPCDRTWIRSIVRQCHDAGVPCFVKQLGGNPTRDGESMRASRIPWTGRLGGGMRDRKGGDPAEWPEDLRVREFPGAVPQ